MLELPPVYLYFPRKETINPLDITPFARMWVEQAELAFQQQEFKVEIPSSYDLPTIADYLKECAEKNCVFVTSSLFECLKKDTRISKVPCPEGIVGVILHESRKLPPFPALEPKKASDIFGNVALTMKNAVGNGTRYNHQVFALFVDLNSNEPALRPFGYSC